MAVYTFSFDSKYAGHTATVTDATGAEVAGSPITLDVDGDGSLNLDTGNYRAQVSNAEGPWGDGYSVVDGVFDTETSIGVLNSAVAATGNAPWFFLAATSTFGDTWVPVTMSTSIDGVRNPDRSDLIYLDPEDDTTLHVVSDGNYLIQIQGGAKTPYASGDITAPGLAAFDMQVKVNGGNEAPAYNVRGGHLFLVDATYDGDLTSTLAFPQPLMAGDTLTIEFRSRNVSFTDGGVSWSAVPTAVVSFARLSTT